MACPSRTAGGADGGAARRASFAGRSALAATSTFVHLLGVGRHGHRERRHDDQRHAGERCAGRVELRRSRSPGVGRHAAGPSAPTDVDGTDHHGDGPADCRAPINARRRGTPVTTGQVLDYTAQPAGLQFDAGGSPRLHDDLVHLLASDGTVDRQRGLRRSATPINDAPVASNLTITAAEESVDTPLASLRPRTMAMH